MQDTYGPQRITPNHLACSTGSPKVSHGKIFQHLQEGFGTVIRGPQRIDTGEFGDSPGISFSINRRLKMCVFSFLGKNILQAIWWAAVILL